MSDIPDSCDKFSKTPVCSVFTSAESGTWRVGPFVSSSFCSISLLNQHTSLSLFLLWKQKTKYMRSERKQLTLDLPLSFSSFRFETRRSVTGALSSIRSLRGSEQTRRFKQILPTTLALQKKQHLFAKCPGNLSCYKHQISISLPFMKFKNQ